MNVAFIPVRGGSKSIPLKNIKEIAQHPLVYWVTKAANDSQSIDKVYIATDCEAIGNVVRKFDLPKVEVIGRSKESATDTASTETAMIEFAQEYEFDTLFLIQATSPLLTADDLDGGFELYNKENTDSVLSVVRQKRFCWRTDERGIASPINYDFSRRPRRQEFEGYLVENGAFYITSRNNLLKDKNRLSGKIRAYEMKEDSYFEIDEPSDWIIIENQLLKREEKNKQALPIIKMFLTDCDGVLTDGGMYYSEKGDELKKFNTKDGVALRMLHEKGVITGIITGETMELNNRRAQKLCVDEIYGGVNNKLDVILQLSNKYGIPLDNIAYVGDDLNDLDAIKAVGFGCTVADGTSEVKQEAKYISKAYGGHGAIREIAEVIISGCGLAHCSVVR